MLELINIHVVLQGREAQQTHPGVSNISRDEAYLEKVFSITNEAEFIWSMGWKICLETSADQKVWK